MGRFGHPAKPALFAGNAARLYGLEIPEST